MFKKRKQRLHKWICSILCMGLLFSQSTLVRAEEVQETEATPTPIPHTEYYNEAAETDSLTGWPESPKIEAQAAVLLDMQSGSVLYAKNPDKKLYPASITKIMTALLGCENLNLKDKLVISETAAYSVQPGDSSIYAAPGEEFTVEQALMAVMLESANEVSVAVGEETSGSLKKFVELMNERARQIGCTNTHFNNPNGLPDKNHFTTARDMAKIAKTAWYNPQFRKFASRILYEVPPTNKFEETRYWLNHHKMMETRDYAYEGVMGGKTGYTVEAGNTLVTYAKRGEMRLVAVVLNSINGAYADTAKLLDYGFNNFQKVSMKVDLSSLVLRNLPCEKYILKNNGNDMAFYYMHQIYTTVPKGFTADQMELKRTFLKSVVGMPRILNEYYYEGHLVGSGVQYEKELLSELLLKPLL